jgi:hypothetical protein
MRAENLLWEARGGSLPNKEEGKSPPIQNLENPLTFRKVLKLFEIILTFF